MRKYLPIGTLVKFQGVSFETSNGKRTVVCNEAFEEGQIVGVTVKFIGIVISGDYEEPGYLKNAKGAQVYEIKTHLACKPKLAYMDKVEIISNPRPLIRLPYKPGYKWNDKERQLLSEDIKSQPRDTKGRWMKTLTKKITA